MTHRSLMHFIFASVFALASLIVYALWFFAFSTERGEAISAASEVIRIENEDAAIANAEDTIAALSADEALLDSYFVSPDGIVTFLEELERSGDGMGSTVDVISVTPAKEDGGRLTVALQIRGSFAGVMRTLGTLEYGPRDIRLISVTIDTVPSEEEVVWTAAATFSVATLPETP